MTCIASVIRSIPLVPWSRLGPQEPPGEKEDKESIGAHAFLFFLGATTEG